MISHAERDTNETKPNPLKRAAKKVARAVLRPKQQAYDWLSRGAIKRDFDEIELRANGYASQCGQDRWIIESMLPARKEGVFVDIGANDGVTLSNTLVLEKDHGWTGLAVEPIPEVFARLRANRTCTVVNGCVGERSGKQRFQVISGYDQMLSGLIDEYDSRHLKRIDEGMATRGGSRREIQVECFRLAELLGAHGIDCVDYLSIDVEGAELSILKAIDWKTIDVEVLGVENNYRDYRIPAFLKRKGYRLHSIVGDEFYVRDRS